MRNWKELQVAQKARQLALDVYACTSSFPDSERFGLVSQLRRASVSIGSNIAEGCGRDSDRELVRYMTIANGSTSEVEFQLSLARDLNFIEEEKYAQIDASIREVGKMLTAFIRAVEGRKLAPVA